MPVVLSAAVRRLAGAGIETAQLDAQLLLAEAAKIDRATMFSRAVCLTPEIRAEFDAMVDRRANHEPIAYILGRREFYSLEFEVNRDVLIPRPQTETVVDAALEFIASQPEARVLDLCTGPGTIAVAIAANAPLATIVAADISPRALAVARGNAARNRVADRIEFVCADLFEPLDLGAHLGLFDIIVCNPPYVSRAEIASLAPDVRDFEPRSALDGGVDGLDFFRRIGPVVPLHLRLGGLLVLEVGYVQDDAVKEILASGGMRPGKIAKDLDGIVRVVTAQR